MNYRRNLEKTVQDMHKMRAADTFELRRLPPGDITIYRSGSRFRYVQERYVNGVRTRRGITRNKKLVSKLLRKRYVKADAAVIDDDIAVMSDSLKKITGNSPETIIGKLPPLFRELPKEMFLPNYALRPQPSRDEGCLARDLAVTRCLDDYVPGVSPQNWATMPYCENTAFASQKTVFAEKGLRARSKSEAEYIRFYESKGILFHYDELFSYLDRSEYDPNGTVRFISPDFVLLRPDGTFLFHEHFGRPDDMEYMQKNLEKLYAYIKLGIMPGIDLMITFERPGGGVDLQLAEAMLDSMLIYSSK